MVYLRGLASFAAGRSAMDAQKEGWMRACSRRGREEERECEGERVERARRSANAARADGGGGAVEE